MKDTNYKGFWNFIKLLHDNDLLEYIIVIGSWAEYLYAQAGILPGFSANLRTLDIDFLIKNMRQPVKPVNIAVLAKEAGYTLDHDVLTATTKIYTPDLMEIEFIIEQKGSGEDPVLKTNLGVNAQALRHLSILKTNSIDINIFGFRVTVPIPEAYVIHKIIINRERGHKAEKDKQAIFTLARYINREKFEDICNQSTKKEHRIIDNFLSENKWP